MTLCKKILNSKQDQYIFQVCFSVNGNHLQFILPCGLKQEIRLLLLIIIIIIRIVTEDEKQHCFGLGWEFESPQQSLLQERGFDCGTKQVYKASIKSVVWFLQPTHLRIVKRILCLYGTVWHAQSCFSTFQILQLLSHIFMVLLNIIQSQQWAVITRCAWLSHLLYQLQVSPVPCCLTCIFLDPTSELY